MKTRHFNPCGIRTYRKLAAISFVMRTYKKGVGGWGSAFCRPVSAYCLLPAVAVVMTLPPPRAWTNAPARRYNASPGAFLRLRERHSPYPPMSSSPELSIVIPAVNEEKRLPRTLRKIHEYLMARSLQAEVLVVDDGSTDSTAKVVDGLCQEYPEVRRITNATNHGKGYAVRQGMLAACGEIGLFMDADLSTPIEEADKLLAALRERDCDGAIGSRALDRGLIEGHQSMLREAGGIVFNRLVRFSTGLRFADTQCGFKAFRLDRARILFEQQRVDGFGFDPEILFLAKRHGLRITEIPVRWAHHPASKVKFAKDGLRMLRDLWIIRSSARRGLYPRRKSRESGT